ncbi:hypothetical protein FCV25MIE_13086 [Fagus crenata]
MGWFLAAPPPPLSTTQTPHSTNTRPPVPPANITAPLTTKPPVPPAKTTTPSATNITTIAPEAKLTIPINQHQNQPKPPIQSHSFNIDRKTFSINQGGGRSYPFCITERKFGKILGKVWTGSKDIEWLGNSIEEAINTGAKRDFFKHRRDGYKALHVIRRTNHYGHFLELSEFHSGSRQGVLRIPEGKEKQGWVRFVNLCKGFWDRGAPAKGLTAFVINVGWITAIGFPEKERRIMSRESRLWMLEIP